MPNSRCFLANKVKERNVKIRQSTVGLFSKLGVVGILIIYAPTLATGAKVYGMYIKLLSKTKYLHKASLLLKTLGIKFDIFGEQYLLEI